MMMKLLTDKEASQRFCPFSFAAPVVPAATAAGWGGGAYGGGGNSAGNRAGPLRCLRGECMAWQVVTDRQSGSFGFCARLGFNPQPDWQRE